MPQVALSLFKGINASEPCLTVIHLHYPLPGSMAQSTPSLFRLPQLQCQFALTYHESGDAVAAASDAWFANGFSNFTDVARRRLNGLKAGQLTAYCYNKTSEDRLRVVCDFMNFVFHLDDLSDNLKSKDTVILADFVMNAFESPYSYCRILKDGRELPEEEPVASKLAREYVPFYSSTVIAALMDDIHT